MAASNGYFHAHPGCIMQLACEESMVHGVIAPVQLARPAFQLHPVLAWQVLAVV